MAVNRRLAAVVTAAWCHPRHYCLAYGRISCLRDVDRATRDDRSFIVGESYGEYPLVCITTAVSGGVGNCR